MSKGRVFLAIIGLGFIVAIASVSVGQSVSADGQKAPGKAATAEAASTSPETEAKPLEPVADGEVGVGVFSPERIWQGWEGRSKMESEHRALQMQMQQAQQQGDQMAMMQAAQRMERAQQELMSTFMSAIEEVAPAIAKEGGLDMVVGEIFYKTDSVTEREVSGQLLAKMNEAVETEPASEED